MKQSYTEQQWIELFEKQKVSGLSVTDFCRQHGTSTSTFHKKRRLILTSEPDVHQREEAEPFIEAKVESIASVQAPVTIREWIEVEVGSLCLRVPTSMSPQWLAALMRECQS